MKEIVRLIVDGHWEPGKGFFLWGKDQKGYLWEPMELKFTLFAGHRPSFYGTFIQEIEGDGPAGIMVSPAQALELFAQPPQPEFYFLTWSAELNKVLKIAPFIRQQLAEGRWMPDFSQWREGKRCWKLLNPPEAGEKDSLPCLGEWVNLVINELVEQNPEIRETWEQLAAAYPLLNPQQGNPASFLDEEDWLQATGWKPDQVPFRTCLQLAEPEEGQPWTLNILLQDKENPQLLVEYRSVTPAAGGLSSESSGAFPAPVIKDPDAPTPAFGSADTTSSCFGCSDATNPGFDCPESWLAYLDRPQRELVKWLRLLPWLQNEEEPPGLKQELTEEEAWEFLTDGSLKLVEAGFTVLLPAWWDELCRQKPRLKVRTKSSVGSAPNSLLGLEQLVRFDWQLAVGEVELSAEEFNRLVEEKRRLMKVRGRWIQVDPAFLHQLRKLMKGKKKGLTLGEVLQMHLLTEAVIPPDPGTDGETANTLPLEVELDSHLAEMVTQLTQTASLPHQEPPTTFRGSLRNYQRTGFSWLMFLRKFGLGGCLADDMGLGKTIQFITYLLALKEREPSSLPSLLICPTSVIGNWQMELQRFAPDLQVHLHYGPQRSKGEALREACLGKDLVITSYTLAHLDREELASLEWNCICLDEAQNIKNAYTKQASAVRRLTGRHKIALTGTPMENRLTELWSIMDFLNPGYLGSLAAFNRQFVKVIEKTRDAATVDRIQRLVRPFLLRRVKTDPAIELDLPEKQEFREYVTLTVEQASLYENILDDMLTKLDTLDPMERRGLILATLTKLKQVCNHPALLLKEGPKVSWRRRSNKLERLLEMVEQLRAEGDRCLIFTQFVEMGSLLQEVLQKELGEPVQFLHGGSSKTQRDAMVARFQDRSLTGDAGCGIFILSLKAGGIGLNLTAANHVFLFDRWWNPAVENQATDRAYRIGQNRHVQVHKFISLGTLEERIDRMIEDKQTLNQLIVGSGENWLTELSTGELREIFALRREWVGSD